MTEENLRKPAFIFLQKSFGEKPLFRMVAVTSSKYLLISFSFPFDIITISIASRYFPNSLCHITYFDNLFLFICFSPTCLFADSLS